MTLIADNKLNYGGAVYASGNVDDVTLTDCRFYGCQAHSGAAVDLDLSQTTNRKIQATGCAFIGCATINDSEGVTYSNDQYAPKHGVLNEGHSVDFHSASTVIDKCVFTDCSSNKWAAAVLTRSNSMKIIDSVFTNCAQTGTDSAQGGAVYMGGAAGGSLELTQSTFKDCDAKGPGGAVYIANKADTVTVTDCSFDTCSADDGNNGNGGALYANTASLSISDDTTFQNCNASGTGGAVWTNADTTEIENTHFYGEGDTATARFGGAIYVSSGDLTIKNSTFESCRASESGGAICHDHSGKLSISDTTFGASGNPDKANSAGSDGGALWIRAAETTVESSQFYGKGSDEMTAQYGGAIFLCSSVSLELKNAVTLSGNRAVYGGALYASANAAVSFGEGGTTEFLNNTAAAKNNEGGFGGGAYLGSGAKFSTLGNVHFYGNSAVHGGGIYSDGATVSLLANTEIGVSGQGNTAVNGGGLFVNGGSASMDGDAHIRYNTSTGGDETNSTYNNGAGIYLSSGTLYISGSAHIDHNTADGRGGALYTAGGEVSISGSSEIHENEAKNTEGGGAVYVYGENTQLVVTGGAHKTYPGGKVVLAQTKSAEAPVEENPEK